MTEYQNDLGNPLRPSSSCLQPLYIVEFKAGRTDLFYVEDPEQLVLQKGDLVVVEADRGKDLGKVLTSCTLDEVREFQMHQVESALGQLAAVGVSTGSGGGTATTEAEASTAMPANASASAPPAPITLGGNGNGAVNAPASGGANQQQQQQQPPSAAAIARMTKEIHPKRIYGRASPADVALLAIKAQDEAKALSVCRAKVAQHQLPMEVTDAEFQL